AQIERSHAEFLKRLEKEGAPRSRRGPSVGAITLAASLFVCATIFVAIFSSSTPSPEEIAAPGLQDKKPLPPQGAEEQSLLAQIALQDKILEKTSNEEERTTVQETLRTLQPNPLPL